MSLTDTHTIDADTLSMEKMQITDPHEEQVRDEEEKQAKKDESTILIDRILSREAYFNHQIDRCLRKTLRSKENKLSILEYITEIVKGCKI